jgi:hypothetical protein
MKWPLPTFAHLERLTDDTGLFEHAQHAVIRREHGYCTDDVARGLLVTCREPDPSPLVTALAERYLAFLIKAQDHRGAFHNRLGQNRKWSDDPGLGDWWGRALWGLGTAAAHSPTPRIRKKALAAFTLGASQRSPWTRAMAFAGLGAAQVLRANPDATVAAKLLADAGTAASACAGNSAAARVWARDPDWPWPEPSLTYANAALAEVIIIAGHLWTDQSLRDTGLRMLSWLKAIQTEQGHLSVTPAAGWQRGTVRARHDQQPIEVATLADACATAAEVTGESHWNETVRQAAAWFLGENDLQVTMWDPATGGSYDGLTPDGPNLNQGAESTIALISTMQQVNRLKDPVGQRS